MSDTHLSSLPKFPLCCSVVCQLIELKEWVRQATSLVEEAQVQCSARIAEKRADVDRQLSDVRVSALLADEAEERGARHHFDEVKHRVEGEAAAEIKHFQKCFDAKVGRNLIDQVMLDIKHLEQHMLKVTKSRYASSPNSSSTFMHPLGEAPDDFLCPISLEMMEEPVIASDGFSYNRTSIQGWLANPNSKRRSPMTNQPLFSDVLVPNRTLAQIIRTWQLEKGYLSQKEVVMFATAQSID